MPTIVGMESTYWSTQKNYGNFQKRYATSIVSLLLDRRLDESEKMSWQKIAGSSEGLHKEPPSPVYTGPSLSPLFIHSRLRSVGFDFRRIREIRTAFPVPVSWYERRGGWGVGDMAIEDRACLSPREVNAKYVGLSRPPYSSSHRTR